MDRMLIKPTKQFMLNVRCSWATLCYFKRRHAALWRTAAREKSAGHKESETGAAFLAIYSAALYAKQPSIRLLVFTRRPPQWSTHVQAYEGGGLIHTSILLPVLMVRHLFVSLSPHAPTHVNANSYYIYVHTSHTAHSAHKVWSDW